MRRISQKNAEMGTNSANKRQNNSNEINKRRNTSKKSSNDTPPNNNVMMKGSKYGMHDRNGASEYNFNQNNNIHKDRNFRNIYHYNHNYHPPSYANHNDSRYISLPPPPKIISQLGSLQELKRSPKMDMSPSNININNKYMKPSLGYEYGPPNSYYSHNYNNHNHHHNDNDNYFLMNKHYTTIRVDELGHYNIQCVNLKNENKKIYECVSITFPPFVKINQMQMLCKKLSSENIVFINQSVAISLMYKIAQIKSNSPVHFKLPIDLVFKLIASFEAIELTSEGIGIICWSLQNLDKNSASTKLLVSSVVPEITKSKALLNGTDMSKACYGLVGLDATHDATIALVNILASKADESCDGRHLNDEYISQVIFGLQNLIGTEASTKKLTRALAKLVTASSTTLQTGRHVYMCCSSLRNLIDCDETRELVTAIASKIDIDIVKVTHNFYLPMCIFGLRNLNRFEESTRALVDALSPMISPTCKNWGLFYIDAALSGLRGVDHTSPTGKLLVEKVTNELIKSSEFKFNKHSLGHNLHAIEYLGATINDDTSQNLIRAITTKLLEVTDLGQDVPSPLNLKHMGMILTQLVHDPKAIMLLSTPSDTPTLSLSTKLMKEIRELYRGGGEYEEMEERLYYSHLVHFMFYFVNDMTSAKDIVRKLLGKDKIKFCKRLEKKEDGRCIEVDLHGHLPITAALIVKCLVEDVCAVELDNIDSIHYYIGNGCHASANRDLVYETVKELVTSSEFLFSHGFVLQEEDNNKNSPVYIKLVQVQSRASTPRAGGRTIAGCLGCPKIEHCLTPTPTLAMVGVETKTNLNQSHTVRENRKRRKDRSDIPSSNDNTPSSSKRSRR